MNILINIEHSVFDEGRSLYGIAVNNVGVNQ